MVKNSYIKGRAYEQKIARLLTRKFDIKFHRVPMSGGFATATETLRPELRGDIFTDDKKWNEKFNVIIECKKIKDPIDLVQYSKFVRGENVMMTKWVLQCIKEASHPNGNHKNFWLIFSWNHGADLIIQGVYATEWLFTPPVELKRFLIGIKED